MSQAGWYGLNSARSYPLADDATGISDDGKFLPEGVLADARIRFSGDVGEIAYVSRLEVSTYVAVVISVGTQAIASVTVARDSIVRGKPIAVTSITREATGWLVFGDLFPIPDTRMSFSTAAQSGLSDFAAYSQLGGGDVKRWGVFNRTLEGTYPRYLVAGNDVRVSSEKRSINGVEVQAVVVGLAIRQNADDSLDSGASADEVLAAYAGKCGRRPESRTCTSPEPIERINGVGPDCCGRVFIELRGCGDILQFDDRCGVAIACDLKASEACPSVTKLPDSLGRLPGEPVTDCEDTDIATSPTSTQEKLPDLPWWKKVRS
jgi:hypothetical protein